MENDQIERAARAMALWFGWKGWDTAKTCMDTPNGCSPEDERFYWRELARVALATNQQQVISEVDLGRLADAFNVEADADAELRDDDPKRLVAFDYYKRGFMAAQLNGAVARPTKAMAAPATLEGLILRVLSTGWYLRSSILTTAINTWGYTYTHGEVLGALHDLAQRGLVRSAPSGETPGGWQLMKKNEAAA